MIFKKSKSFYIRNRQDGGLFEINRDFSLRKYELQNIQQQVNWSPVYSDAYELKRGNYVRYHLSLGQFILLFFFSHGFQLKAANGMIWYPFATKKGYLSFSYRSNNGFSNTMRKKQSIAVILANAVNLFLPFNRPNLIFEKLSNRAQESGFEYFQYVRKHYPQENNYFVIKSNSPDLNKIHDKKKIVIHGSFKHFYLLIRAKLFISSETPGHAYFWRENMGLTANVVRTKPYVFLQHGVLGFKKLDNLFYGDRLTAPVRLITSSQFEQDIVTRQLGYDVQRAPITGLARWDLINLEQERIKLRDKILLFYTWRPWLDDVDDETFVQSDYFLAIKHSIQQIKMMHLDKQIIVMMHPKMHAALDEKEIFGIKLWTDNDGPLNELMSSVALLITDYSSLAWEAYYREVPVIFDMFDQQRYENEVGSYIDLNHIPFGSKVTKDIRDNIQEVIAQSYHLKLADLQQKHQYFAFEDQNASQRIHEVVENIDIGAINRDKRQLIIKAIVRLIFKK